MKFKDFMNMYDNWNGIVVVNNRILNLIAKGTVSYIMEEENGLLDEEVVSFGFYDNELCVRVL